MICMFLDGPIAGDVRTDQPRRFILRIPVPKRVTYCDCDTGESSSYVNEPEVVEYRAIAYGQRVAIYSCKPDATDDQIVRMLTSWQQHDLGNPLWERHCRERGAFT